MSKLEPYKTHLAYVKERRTEEEAAALLDEALDAASRAPRHGAQGLSARRRTKGRPIGAAPSSRCRALSAVSSRAR